MTTKISRRFITFVTIILFLSISACKNENYTPKPRGYFEIKLPVKAYKQYEKNNFYSFEYPEYSFIQENTSEKDWINMVFSQNKATIYLTYITVENNIYDLFSDARDLAYKHTIKADAIKELSFSNDTANVHGVLYDIKGNVASNIQFFVTDSTKHFLRGSLYFNVRPNKDSLAPVIDFIKEDIIHLMETTQWK